MSGPAAPIGQRHGGYRCDAIDMDGVVCDRVACFIFAPPGIFQPRGQDRLAACPDHRGQVEATWKDRNNGHSNATTGDLFG